MAALGEPGSLQELHQPLCEEVSAQEKTPLSVPKSPSPASEIIMPQKCRTLPQLKENPTVCTMGSHCTLFNRSEIIQ